MTHGDTSCIINSFCQHYFITKYRGCQYEGINISVKTKNRVKVEPLLGNAKN